jgi:hypothetical protein
VTARLRGVVVLGLALAACGGDGGAPPATSLAAEVASYDLAAGPETRLIFGLFTGRNEFVSGGEVDARIFFLGEEQAEGPPELVHEATARFVPIPGSPHPPHPEPGPASHGQGVYEVKPITFERAGLYEVKVTAELPAGSQVARAAFTVQPEPRIPAPGDRAIATENLTVDSDAPPGAIDSRAAVEGEIPDPALHRTTIAEAVRSGTPAVVVFATPVYCVSRFCGPVTEMVEGLARRYGDRAAFIHVEIWRDFQGKVVNEAAAEWLLHEGGLTEPWVFAIDGRGRIAERWDNVAEQDEIEAWLRQLP